tara:strand:+ start:63 stop:545 length:483 start_codon:yes stop_codon:yes gene_type:complete
LESRKYQLQQQIKEALQANDNDLYSLLKSQWAHRFGVESLEELQNLDLTLLDQKTINKDNQKNDQSENPTFEVDKEISIKDDDNNEKEITSDTKKLVDSAKVENKDSFEIKSAEIVFKENHLNKTINTDSEHKSIPKVKALIPLPPKPKYGYLKKWLLRS